MANRQIVVTELESREKLTAKLFFQPLGENGYITTGNIADYKTVADRATKQHMEADHGFRYINDEQVDVTGFAFDFTMTERAALACKVLTLGEAATVTSQSAVTAPSATATITAVELGKSYFIGKVGIDTLVVKVSSTTMVLGTDYTADLKTGMITVLAAPATIIAGDNLSLTFGTPARTIRNFTTGTAPIFHGTIRVEERNQFSHEPFRVTSGLGVLIATSQPEQSGEFAKWTIRARYTGQPTVAQRDTLNT